MALRCARIDFSNRPRAQADSRERRMSKTAHCAEYEAASVVAIWKFARFTF